MNESRETVIGIFNDRISAQRAMDDLKAIGIDEQGARLVGATTDDMPANASMNTSTETAPHHKRGFFERLFGTNIDAHDDRYNDYSTRLNESDQYFSNLHQNQRTLVVVEGPRATPDAEAVLRRNGATIESRASQLYDQHREGLRTLRLFEEELLVNKERVETGEVAVHKEVVTEKKTIEVPVEREEVVIERRAVTGEGEVRQGAISANALQPGEEIRIPVSEEEVTVEKRTVPREEVTVGKRTVEDVERRTEDVKHEEARVESKGRVKVTDDRRKPPTPDTEQPRV